MVGFFFGYNGSSFILLGFILGQYYGWFYFNIQWFKFIQNYGCMYKCFFGALYTFLLCVHNCTAFYNLYSVLSTKFT